MRRMRTTGVVFLALVLICALVPARAQAAGLSGRAGRLTGYAPLYLPSMVTITVQASPNSFGTVTGGASGIAPGGMVTVTATPNQGYYFSGWFEDGRLVSDSAAFTFPAERDMNLVAHFSDRETNNDRANPEASADTGNTDQENEPGGENSGEENSGEENSGAENSGGNEDASGQEQDGDGNSDGNSAPDGDAFSAERMQDGNNPPDQAGPGAGGASGDQGSSGGAGAQDAANTGDGSAAGSSRPDPIVPVVPPANRAVNAADMPTTGAELYRVPLIVVLVLFGVIAVLISIPLKGRGRR